MVNQYVAAHSAFGVADEGDRGTNRQAAEAAEI